MPALSSRREGSIESWRPCRSWTHRFAAQSSRRGPWGAELNERSLHDAAVGASEEVDPSDDIHADADYGKRLVGHLVRRAPERVALSANPVEAPVEQVGITVEMNGLTFARPLQARLFLGDFNRDELELTGTHVGCEHGVGGACTILFDGQPVGSSQAETENSQQTKVFLVGVDGLEPPTSSL